MTRHLPHQQQRRVTQLHLLARLHCKPGHFFGRDLRHQFCDASGDLHAILIELALPEQASQHRALQLQLRRDVARRRTLMRPRPEVQLQHVQSSHHGLLV